MAIKAPGRRDVGVRELAEAGGDEARPAKANRRGDILLAAERLFARKGYASTSVRDIAAAAQVPIQLIRYHFGSKEELYSFIFESHRPSIDERRQAIAAVSGRPGRARAERVVRAWTEPVLRERSTMQEGSFSVLMAHTVWEVGDENRRILERFYDPLAKCFIAAMSEALPHLDETTILWSYQFALGALLIFIADDRVERLSSGQERAADPRRGEQLIQFITAGFLNARSPVTVALPISGPDGGGEVGPRRRAT